MELKIGVGIPCHTRDIPLLERYALPSLCSLNPMPYKILVLVNDGNYKNLKEIKIEIIDSLFLEYDCDIVLSACADYLFIDTNLMNYIHPNKIMNYGRMLNTPIIGLMWVIARRLVKKPWSSMFSIPKNIWFNIVRDNPLYNGNDGSIPIVMNNCFESHMGINYMLMRRDTKRLIDDTLNNPRYRNTRILRRMIRMSRGIKI